jgi:hypothetical protein
MDNVAAPDFLERPRGGLVSGDLVTPLGIQLVAAHVNVTGGGDLFRL